MADAGRGTRFFPKQLPGGLACIWSAYRFESDAPVQPLVVGLVNDAHATFAELAENPVASDTIQTDFLGTGTARFGRRAKDAGLLAARCFVKVV